MALRRQLPFASISWIIGKTEAKLLAGMPNCEFIIFDKALGLGAYRDVWRQLRGRRFDALLLLHASARANILSMGLRATRRIGFDKTRAREGQRWFSNEQIPALSNAHVLDGFLQFVTQLSGTAAEPDWQIPLSPTDAADARAERDDKRPLVVISPCSSVRSNNFRNWAVERYAAISRYAAERHNATILVTGQGRDDERTYAAAMLAAAGPAARSRVGTTSLPGLYARIAEADLVIAPDSGPVHMAVAAGTPVIGLYATSNPDRTGPYRSRDLLINAYPRAVKTFLGKSVDEVRWGQRVRDPAALDLIEVDEVCARIDQVLGKSNTGSSSDSTS